MSEDRGSVELGGVTKRFGATVAVDRLDLEIRPGEFLSLLGPSGCGKTSTLRMLAGFEQPDEGWIRISGEYVQHVPPHKRDVMLDGHIEQLADPDTVYDEPASAFVAGFIGQNNSFPGTTDDTGRGLFSDGCAILAGRAAAGVIGGAGGIAAVRPEALDVIAADIGPGVNRVEGVLAGTAHLGDVVQFVVRVGDRELLSRRPRHRTPPLQPGQRVWCQWDEAQVHLFPDAQAGLVLVDPAEEAAPA